MRWFANLHCLGDASSLVGFIQAWASISKLGRDEEFLTKQGESLPILDRYVIKDPLGIDTTLWKEKREVYLKSSSFSLPTNRVRATYILHKADIEKLKDMVLAKKPGLLQVSSFVVTMSYIWTCSVKSGEQVDDDVLKFLIFPADIRERIDQPVPAKYFDRVNKRDEVFKGSENWLSEIKKVTAPRLHAVSGSPKFHLYIADFGWGSARKIEVVSIDGEKYAVFVQVKGFKREDWRLVCLCRRQEWKLLLLSLKTD
ncbi:UNVERIFIED_CONTAM: Malonyl-coenzyme:anthocyanin 5-O-glucoside-6'''-O-malonyltransferase [Sesamum latifolium]|uniref:Malonyl-coenzyme:anthocyanin 5-O-glucoside-6'''-O-malonyltransferase n=1 Tax=Sesamum latifolium TaxID=2727402 RepID=A0AAW2SRB4_9LAMI